MQNPDSENSIFNEIDNFFDDISPDSAHDSGIKEHVIPEAIKEEPADIKGKKRSWKDFNPDMDALLLTAQSPMITDSIILLSKSDFSQSAFETYKEGYNGITVYIKILGRNPDNYNKLQAVINSDSDCKEVEDTAFKLYSKKTGYKPEDAKDKITAFEMLGAVIRNALSRATLQQDINSLKPFLTLHGTISQDNLKAAYDKGDKNLEKIVIALPLSISIARKILESGSILSTDKSVEKSRLSAYILNATLFLYQYYSLKGSLDAAKTYLRMHETHKKYWVSR